MATNSRLTRSRHLRTPPKAPLPNSSKISYRPASAKRVAWSAISRLPLKLAFWTFIVRELLLFSTRSRHVTESTSLKIGAGPPLRGSRFVIHSSYFCPVRQQNDGRRDRIGRVPATAWMTWSHQRLRPSGLRKSLDKNTKICLRYCIRRTSSGKTPKRHAF